jgi:zinc-ribbon domain
MADENATSCTNCGAPLKEGASFCTNCGAAAAVTTPPPAPPAPPIPPPGVPVAGGEVPTAPMPAVYPEAGVAPMAPRKRSKAPLIIGIFGGLLVIGGVVVLILFLTVWSGGSSGGGTGTPQALAEKYMSAMEKGDVDAYMDCFQSDYFSSAGSSIMEDMGIDVKKMLEMGFQYVDVKFTGVKLNTQSEKGDTAVVVTTGGTVDISVMGMGDTVDLAQQPMTFNMVKTNGRWYLTEDPMPSDLGTGNIFQDQSSNDFNLNDINPNELNLQDLQNLLPQDMNLQDLQNLLPEDFNLNDLQNMSQEDLDQLLQELEQWLQQNGTPPSTSTPGGTV